MKRLIIVASLAILAVGCQKTFVENEVRNQIGFNTEIDKMTRTVNTGTTFENTDFTVFSYGYQGENGAHDGVMVGVKVAKDDKGDWKATGETKYYWPNSADTKLNFYAYSPANLGFSHSEAKGFYSPEGVPFVLADNKTDFMVATPVEGATYGDQNGNATEVVTTGVPMVFNHQLTQVVFKVTSNIAGVTATLNSITLNDLSNSASYDQKRTVPGENDVPVNKPWYGHVDTDTDYTINVNSTGVSTDPVVLLPQSLDGLTFDISYNIAGNNIANETVVRPGVVLKTTNLTEWIPNMRVVYTVNVGLTEITFTPSVALWDNETGDTIGVQ